MRPAYVFSLLLLILLTLDTGLFLYVRHDQEVSQGRANKINDVATAGLGLTDLCLATEARYTRHPAVSDHLTPFMDHPGAIEHFPTGSFWSFPED